VSDWIRLCESDCRSAARLERIVWVISKLDGCSDETIRVLTDFLGSEHQLRP
jgi:hypothetical protein